MLFILFFSKGFAVTEVVVYFLLGSFVLVLRNKPMDGTRPETTMGDLSAIIATLVITIYNVLF